MIGVFKNRNGLNTVADLTEENIKLSLAQNMKGGYFFSFISNLSFPFYSVLRPATAWIVNRSKTLGELYHEKWEDAWTSYENGYKQFIAYAKTDADSITDAEITNLTAAVKDGFNDDAKVNLGNKFLGKLHKFLNLGDYANKDAAGLMSSIRLMKGKSIPNILIEDAHLSTKVITAAGVDLNDQQKHFNTYMTNCRNTLDKIYQLDSQKTTTVYVDDSPAEYTVSTNSHPTYTIKTSTGVPPVEKTMNAHILQLTLAKYKKRDSSESTIKLYYTTRYWFL
jgi:hypothetical protein